MSELVERVQALADDARRRHRYWHITSARQSLCVLVAPAMTQAEVDAQYKGCQCYPMTDEEIAKWIAG